MIKSSRGCCGAEELAQLKEAFEYGYFGLAYKVNDFEKAVGEYLCTDREVIATNTGTSALHLALAAAGIGEGDEVILPSFTFVATAQAVTACGATPVFCEVCRDTKLMDIKDVESKITDKTAAIMPVHYAGFPCDIDAIMQLAKQHRLRVIEDAAHAFGSDYNGKKVGSIGDIVCFSFDSIKVMTCGEGGAIVTADREVAENARKMRLLGIDRKSMVVADWKKRSWVYDVPVQGFRYHMSNLNAAIGLAQLGKLERFIKRRRELCHLYDRLLADIPLVTRPVGDWDSIAPFMYVIEVANEHRNALKDYLKDNDIESGISYIPCHSFELYSTGTPMPVTESIYAGVLSLPLHFELSDEDVATVCETIKRFCSEVAR